MEQKKVDLSIITPVFNARKFIGLCIENVLAQGCKEAEHIIVDGGSTDGTVEIISRYAAQYPHIRWVSEKDQGQSDAMNKGIQMAEGEMISFLNADDFYVPGTFNRIRELIHTKKFPVPSILIGKLNIIDQQDQVSEVQFTEKITPINVLRFWKRNTYPGNPTCYFYHKKLHNHIGLYEVEDHLMMDYVFFIKASSVAHFYYISEVWGNYRWIPGTKTFENNLAGNSRGMKEMVFHRFKKHLNIYDSLRLRYDYRKFKRENSKSRKVNLSQRLLKLGKRIKRLVIQK